jgi:hypothetical protein
VPDVDEEIFDKVFHQFSETDGTFDRNQPHMLAHAVTLAQFVAFASNSAFWWGSGANPKVFPSHARLKRKFSRRETPSSNFDGGRTLERLRPECAEGRTA